MGSTKTTARVVGVLFILATALAVIGDRLLRPIRDEADYLTAIATHEDRVIVGMFTELLLAAAVIAIAVGLAPILRQQSPQGALGYVAARIVEGTIIIMGAISSLLLLTLSEHFGEAGAASQSAFEPLGDLLVSSREWTDALGPSIVFAVSALILYTVLYRARLVPTWLSVWGLVGAALLLVAGTLALYGESPTSIRAILLTVPIGVQEMVLAVWLIVRGFTIDDPGRRTVSFPVDDQVEADSNLGERVS